MAQLGSAGALGALGRRFESCRPDSLNPGTRKVSQACLFYLLAVSDEKGALKGALNSNYKYGLVLNLFLIYIEKIHRGERSLVPAGTTVHCPKCRNWCQLAPYDSCHFRARPN